MLILYRLYFGQWLFCILGPLCIDNFEPLCKLLTVVTAEMHLNDDYLKQLATENHVVCDLNQYMMKMM